jgi:hypothetical protein
VFYSLWHVVEAINQLRHCVSEITHPKKIANDFLEKSNAGFDNCLGAVDGILIWLQKPTMIF